MVEVFQVAKAAKKTAAKKKPAQRAASKKTATKKASPKAKKTTSKKVASKAQAKKKVSSGKATTRKATTKKTPATAGTLTFSDPADGDSAPAFTIDTGAGNGSASIDAGGYWTYTPNANFHGADSFVVSASDDDGNLATQVIDLSIAQINDAGIFGGDLAAVIDANTSADGTATFSDGADGASSPSFIVSTGASDGIATIDAAGNWSYTPDVDFVGADEFIVSVTDDDGNVEIQLIEITVNPVASGPNLSHGSITNVGSSWQTVNLGDTYTSMVVVATPRYDSGSGPGVVRIQNVTANSFEVRVDNVGSAAFSGGVHYVAVEEGVYDEPGYKLEAVKYSEAQTSRKGSWGIDTLGYQQSYSSPVVVGQVMSANDSDWSVFWASSNSRTSPPSASQLNVGKHVAEDPNTSRATETIGYLVIEATQSGTIEGLPFVAGVGSDIVRGVGNGTYEYSYTAMPNAKTAVLSSAGMDGGDGGWPVLRGTNPLPPAGGTIDLSIDEDQLGDSERNHTTEQVAYFVIDPPAAQVTAAEVLFAAPAPQSETMASPEDDLYVGSQHEQLSEEEDLVQVANVVSPNASLRSSRTIDLVFNEWGMNEQPTEPDRALEQGPGDLLEMLAQQYRV